MSHLFSLCWLNDGWHWLRIAVDGTIVCSSKRGFVSRDEARFDLTRHFQD